MQRVRPAAVAGSFYPAEPRELRELLHDCFTSHRLGPQDDMSANPSLLGGMVPHAGYVYSGPCAAHFYARLDPRTRCVILLGVNHRGAGARVALSPADRWATPLGAVGIDQDLAAELKGQSHLMTDDALAHRREHSIEVQLPFLQSVLGGFTLLPLSLARINPEECAELGRAVARVYETAAESGKNPVVLASSDLSHYLSPEETERLDSLALAPIAALDPVGLLETVSAEKISMCGVLPTAVLLFAARELGAKRARLLKHSHSGEAVPMSQVVGYASMAVEF